MHNYAPERKPSRDACTAALGNQSAAHLPSLYNREHTLGGSTQHES